jgi:carbonic anhydrase
MADNSAEMAHLLAGYKRFREGTYVQNQERFESLANAQSPKAAIVCCCDSRADPSMILDVNPGELFVIRNVANLVPPYEVDGAYHGTSAALEFAVEGLHIKDIIVMGHARCGGIHALYENAPKGHKKGFVGQWMNIATELALFIRRQYAHETPEKQRDRLERESVLASIDRLKTFPFVEAALKEGRLRLHAWFFDIGNGILLEYDEKAEDYRPVDLPG